MPRHKLILDRGNQRQRVVDRRGLGRLRDSTITKTTLKRYLLAVGHFYYWAWLTYGTVGDTWETLEAQTCEWVEALWEDGDAKAIAADTLSGI